MQISIRTFPVIIILALILYSPSGVRAEQYGEFTYSLVAGNVTILDFNEEISGPIVIPESINGYPVSAIGDFAFDNCRLTLLTIPDSVITIGEGAFRNSRLSSPRARHNSFSILQENYLKTIRFPKLSLALDKRHSGFPN
ncbi:MAG: leucine-rich repeat protein [Verrucomicrobia bacterium]|nr:leucine-rich repeat protein [Verrucomicrobiota bacterium]MDA1066651.1 leucine-rich repeat protein [Verrucomicrobiota bacterium]